LDETLETVAKTVKRGSIGEKREAVNMIEQSKF
jgi:hypothetical protein